MSVPNSQRRCGLRRSGRNAPPPLLPRAVDVRRCNRCAKITPGSARATVSRARPGCPATAPPGLRRRGRPALRGRSRSPRRRRRRRRRPTSTVTLPSTALARDGWHAWPGRTWPHWPAPRRPRSRRCSRPGRGARSCVGASSVTGSGDALTVPDNAGSRPRSVSTAGWMPRASSRSSSRLVGQLLLRPVEERGELGVVARPRGAPSAAAARARRAATALRRAGRARACAGPRRPASTRRAREARSSSSARAARRRDARSGGAAARRGTRRASARRR